MDNENRVTSTACSSISTPYIELVNISFFFFIVKIIL